MSPDLRVVLDTNVLVSAVLRSRSVPRQAYDLSVSRGRLLISAAVLLEIRDVLQRPKLDKYVTSEERTEFLAALVRDTEAVQVTDMIQVCRDPDDNKFLELSVAGHATHLVTGDADLLVLHPFRGVQIVAPQQFVAFVSAVRGNGSRP